MSMLWTSISFSYVASIALWQKGNKKIAIFGDIHEKNKPDICHRNLFTPFLAQMAEGNRKVEFILEHLLEEKVKGEKNPQCIRYLSQYAFEHQLKKGPLTFILSDIRNVLPGLGEMALCVYLLLIQIAINNRVDLNNLLSPRTISTSVVLEEIKVVLDVIQELKKKTLRKEAQTFFTDMHQKLTKYYQDLDNFFKMYNGEAGIIDKEGKVFSFHAGSIMASFLYAIPTNNSWDKLNHLINHYVKPIAYDIANSMFIRDIIESQERVDATLVYAGGAHTVVINRFLLDLGYTLNKDTSSGSIFYTLKVKEPAIPKKHLEKFLADFLK
jgi:hypothetical protein